MLKTLKIICLFICPVFYTELNAKEIVLGIDRISEYAVFFKGKTAGLITNRTGITGTGESSIEALRKHINLKVLFSPEHGLQGAEREGAFIEHSIDKKSGLKIFSLYGKSKKPSSDMLKDIDLLCFDIQDAGARFYTYIYTMAYAMQACKENGKTFVVFDRPNPIGGINIEGNILEKEYSSFVGLYPIVQRHGMTVGELAQMFNTEFGINCTLKVIGMKNWKREAYFDSLSLIWVPPSPNIPTVETAIVYAGVCIFEATNISVGRGTTMPFLYIGAPFINAENLAEKLNALKLDGVHFLPAYFTPSASLYKDKFCEGVQIAITDRSTFKPVKTAITMFFKIQEEYPDDFSVNDSKNKRCGLNLLTGRNLAQEKELTLEKVLKSMSEDEKRFSVMRKKYLLY